MSNYAELTASTIAILQQDVENTIPALKARLAALLKLTAPILDARCDVQCKLALEKNRLRMPKDKEYTDFDRQIMLDGAVAELQAEYNLLKGLEEQLILHIQSLAVLG